MFFACCCWQRSFATCFLAAAVRREVSKNVFCQVFRASSNPHIFKNQGFQSTKYFAFPYLRTNMNKLIPAKNLKNRKKVNAKSMFLIYMVTPIISVRKFEMILHSKHTLDFTSISVLQ